MSDSEDKVLDSEIIILKKMQSAHIEMGGEMLRADNGNMFAFDLFAAGVFHRSMMLIDGFVRLIPDNFISAAPLVRMQLDNFLRTSAVHVVGMSSHDFAVAVINGQAIRSMQHKKTKRKLTDAELVSIFEKQFPGLEAFYKKSSGYVHFSETHIFHTVSANSETGTFKGAISKVETFVPERLRIEAASTMVEITKLVLWQLDNWIFTKSNPDLAKKVLAEGYEMVRIKEEVQN